MERMSLSGSFTPDTLLVSSVLPSPNHGPRPEGVKPDLLVLHYTGMVDAASAIARLRSPAAEVSAHYVVEETGRVVQLVPEARRAWHAGHASWEGERDVNARSIGIEIVNGGHDFGNPGFPLRQVDAVIALCGDICARYAIRADRVLGHSDVSPGRKRDPGEKFPWDELHRAGIGHFVAPSPFRDGPALKPHDRNDGVRALQQLLSYYGYGVTMTGIYDDETEAVVTAFQRHFRPARVDGVADLSTLKTLRDLIAARPRDPD
jgi:N-acetylmuramoyl-L-alanine amidase